MKTDYEVMVGGTGFTKKVTDEGLRDESDERTIGNGVKRSQRQLIRDSVDNFMNCMRVIKYSSPNRGLTLPEMLNLLNTYFKHPSEDYKIRLDELAKGVKECSAGDITGAMPPEIYTWLADHHPDKFQELYISPHEGRPLSGPKRGKNASKTPDGA